MSALAARHIKDKGKLCGPKDRLTRAGPISPRLTTPLRPETPAACSPILCVALHYRSSPLTVGSFLVPGYQLSPAPPLICRWLKLDQPLLLRVLSSKQCHDNVHAWLPSSPPSYSSINTSCILSQPVIGHFAQVAWSSGRSHAHLKYAGGRVTRAVNVGKELSCAAIGLEAGRDAMRNVLLSCKSKH